VERQVDLVFAILTEKLAEPNGDPRAPQVESPRAAKAGGAGETVVYAWKENKEASADGARSKQLEIENLHLKQLVGNLSLEKKLLLDRLAALESSAK
jgi:hypothetical protein